MSQNISTFSNVRPSKIYPNWDFWFEKKPYGNPGPTDENETNLAWQSASHGDFCSNEQCSNDQNVRSNPSQIT
jgi:hypothetical protein